MPQPATTPGKVLLEMRGIGKSFPGVKALQGVSLTVREGQVHALLGENGAGKSTLIKILSGAYTRDEGEIHWEGRPAHIHGPEDAQALGISTIYQEFNLAKNLTVAENIFLGQLPRKGIRVDWSAARRRARELLDRLGAKIRVDATVQRLSVAEQQLVEIAKALNRKTRILVMDEPSAVLGEGDLERLFEVVRSLQAQGIGIVYISHRLVEIFELADEVTVLKDGRYVGTRHVAEVKMEELVRLMIGRDLMAHPDFGRPGGRRHRPAVPVRLVSRAGPGEDQPQLGPGGRRLRRPVAAGVHRAFLHPPPVPAYSNHAVRSW